MLIRLTLSLIAVVLTALPAAAQSRPAIAYTTANLNMRTGPGTNYQILTTIPRGGGVTIFGCTADFRWCDAAFTNVKGWVSGRYLSYGGEGIYYGRPIPSAGIYLGVPRYHRDYPIYDRPPVVVVEPVQPARPAPYRPRYPGYPPRYFEHQVY
ncbi:SH3 domain-containing protein [Labrenzia sp. 011]|uniref:SH3 domain-containing protein n=1 Tax=Labrenzia sp. 011 TaxID=2171494 RepID=UPI001402104B|nr:SH3 domain-containing protein [Labrenzia sp. 011]